MSVLSDPDTMIRRLLCPSLDRYAGLEGPAARISDNQTGKIPGLLQTTEYAHAMVAGYPGSGDVRRGSQRRYLI